ncbi:hypothetical protein [Streptomyces sp. NBC_01751]|uniref:hypothetical protein n=1 Tax=Streptomyces sp. NBC_01751 TaxID=2975929 RepID=UPI002DD8C106|nr:hypothetical protein [Streptomyces sp. NBC_01751]WSD24567.1 hypothetical protein OHA26_14330 [Streptomyces sp. NBC_01751]
MPWKYVVEECKAETHDEECGPWEVDDIQWGERWKDAYRKAEGLPHAIVSRQYTGALDWSKSLHTAFEHIEGGGLCWQCGKERGPLCQTATGNKFVCAGCQAVMRRSIEQSARDLGIDPDRRSYVPIIDTLDLEA